jgi:hypothetical protein
MKKANSVSKLAFFLTHPARCAFPFTQRRFSTRWLSPAPAATAASSPATIATAVTAIATAVTAITTTAAITTTTRATKAAAAAAAAAEATTTTAKAAAATTSGATARRTLVSRVDSESATFQVCAVHASHRLLRRFGRTHRYKSETT